MPNLAAVHGIEKQANYVLEIEEAIYISSSFVGQEDVANVHAVGLQVGTVL